MCMGLRNPEDNMERFMGLPTRVAWRGLFTHITHPIKASVLIEFKLLLVNNLKAKIINPANSWEIFTLLFEEYFPTSLSEEEREFLII